MDLKEAIYSRRSVREFTAEPVSEAIIRELIDAAIQAPSAVNQQPCSFCVVRDQNVLATISREAKAHMVQNHADRAHVASFQRSLERSEFQHLLSRAGADSDFHRGGHPMGGRRLRARGGEPDAGGARRGLGTCWIGFAQAWLGTPEGKALLKLPAAYKPVAPIIVGHPKAAPPPVPRKEPEIRWIG